MKAFLLILVASISINLSIQNSEQKERPLEEDKELILIPGVGFKDMRIGDTFSKGKFDFRKSEFDISKGKSIACGRKATYRTNWKRYSNSDLGLVFEYKSESFEKGKLFPNKKLHLTRIHASKPSICCTIGDICIGKSSYSEVLSKFGEVPTIPKNKKYLRFNEKGIAFRFNDNETLIEIEIFKPI